MVVKKARKVLYVSVYNTEHPSVTRPRAYNVALQHRVSSPKSQYLLSVHGVHGIHGMNLQLSQSHIVSISWRFKFGHWQIALHGECSRAM